MSNRQYTVQNTVIIFVSLYILDQGRNPSSFKSTTLCVKVVVLRYNIHNFSSTYFTNKKTESQTDPQYEVLFPILTPDSFHTYSFCNLWKWIFSQPSLSNPLFNDLFFLIILQSSRISPSPFVLLPSECLKCRVSWLFSTPHLDFYRPPDYPHRKGSYGTMGIKKKVRLYLFPPVILFFFFLMA